MSTLPTTRDQLKLAQEKAHQELMYGTEGKMIIAKKELNGWSQEMKTEEIQLKWNTNSNEYKQRARGLICEKPQLASLRGLTGIAAWRDNKTDPKAVAKLVKITDYDAVNQLYILCIL